MDYEKAYKEALERAFEDFNTTLKDCLTWLKKQGEQKPTQETEPFEAEHGKYYYCIKDYFCGGKKQASKGDVVQALRGLPIMGLKDASEYFLPVNFIKCNSTWSKEDKEMFNCISDSLCYLRKLYELSPDKVNDYNLMLEWFRNSFNSIKSQCKQWCDVEDEEIYNSFKTICRILIENPSGESFQAERIYAEKMLNWLETLKDRVQPQQKQEWSEENEKIINDAIWLIEHYATDGHKKLLREQTIDKLKSLKPQPRWKPTEEQMEALCKVAFEFGNSCLSPYSDKDKELVSLYNDLKAL